MTTDTTKPRRGRPVIVHDNHRVQSFLLRFTTVWGLFEAVPALQDAFTGLARAKTAGDTARWPCSVRTVFELLSRCEIINTETVRATLPQDCSASTVKRHTLSARAASVVLGLQLDRHPEWEDRDAPGVVDLALFEPELELAD